MVICSHCDTELARKAQGVHIESISAAHLKQVTGMSLINTISDCYVPLLKRYLLPKSGIWFRRCKMKNRKIIRNICSIPKNNMASSFDSIRQLLSLRMLFEDNGTGNKHGPRNDAKKVNSMLNPVSAAQLPGVVIIKPLGYREDSKTTCRHLSPLLLSASLPQSHQTLPQSHVTLPQSYLKGAANLSSSMISSDAISKSLDRPVGSTRHPLGPPIELWSCSESMEIING